MLRARTMFVSSCKLMGRINMGIGFCQVNPQNFQRMFFGNALAIHTIRENRP